MSASIPILDLSELTTGGLATDDLAVHKNFADAFRAAFSDTGFAYLSGHGIQDALVARVMDENRRFHTLTASSKRAIALDSNHRGYIGLGTSTDRGSTLAKVTKANVSESFMVMREDAANSSAVRAGEYLAGPNQWPDELPGFQTNLEDYVVAMSALARKILLGCALSLNDMQGELLDDFAPATTWLRLLRYPGTPLTADGPLTGSAPHHDFGAITLLAQDDVGGLEVMTPGGGWIAVEPRDGCFVLNAGEMLHRYSGGLLRATPHRVINRSAKERFSVAFFYDPNMSATVRPLGCCRTAATQSTKDEIRFDQFIRTALTQSYEKHAD